MKEPYDGNKIAHNDCPPLALSDSQRFGDPDGSQAEHWAAHDERVLEEPADVAYEEDQGKIREQEAGFNE